MTDKIFYDICSSGYIFVPIICIILMIIMQKWWKYALCTADWSRQIMKQFNKHILATILLLTRSYECSF